MDSFLFNRAGTLHDLGRFDDALVDIEQCLQGNIDSTLNFASATALKGQVLRDQGAYKEAMPLFERSLAINEKQLGPQHPHVAASLNTLASLLQDQGAYEQARLLYERSLAICTAKLSAEHRYTRTAREGFNECADRVTSRSSDDC